MSQPQPVLLTEAPVRVTGAGKEALRLVHDVAPYSVLDLELQVFDGTNVELRLLTSMSNDSEEDWLEVDRFIPTTAPGAERKTFFPLLRYARWEVLSASAATFLLHGIGSRRLGFLPTDIDNCAVWLRADLGISVVSGAVSSWMDKSGLGNHMSQATSSKRPAYVANAVGGQPALSFDGVDDHLTGTLATVFAGTTQDLTIFSVANIDSTTPSGRAALYELTDDPTITNRGPMLFISGGTSFFWRCFDTGAGQASYASPPFDSWHVHHGWHQTTERRVYLDNVEKASNTTDVSSHDLTAHTVGILQPSAAPPPYYPLKGMIAETIVYQRKLADAETALVHAYVKSRYGF
jgi:hypothetical protein